MTEKEIEQLKYIKIVSNEIYFYCDVSVESVAEFNTELRKLDKELRTKYIEMDIDDIPVIKIYIHSPGGDVHAGFGAHDHIQRCKSHVITIADGFTASAAAIMYLGGHERFITKNAWILIHQIGTEIGWGSFDEIKAEVDNCQQIMKHMRSMCKRMTNIPEAKLDKLMQQDVIMSSKKCLKYGVSTKICAA